MLADSYCRSAIWKAFNCSNTMRKALSPSSRGWMLVSAALCQSLQELLHLPVHLIHQGNAISTNEVFLCVLNSNQYNL